MIRKSLTAAAVLAASVGAASPAAAAGAGGETGASVDASVLDKLVECGVANDALGAAWNWDGPANIASGDAEYNTGGVAYQMPPQPGCAGIANRANILPWNWNGPLNVLNSNAPYTAGAMRPANPVVTDAGQVDVKGTATAAANSAGQALGK